MSSGEEFEVGEILEQRKRKGILEYLVRWQGFNDLYDSWEPASGLTNCAAAIKAFAAKNKQRSRSRSRGRSATKSKSRSRSRGRQSKSGSTPSRSRSHSASRKTTQSSTKTSRKSTSEVSVTKKEASPAKPESRGRARSRAQNSEEKASTSRTELVSQRVSTMKEGGILERKTEVVKKSVETIRATPVKMESTAMTTRSRLAVRQVENDQKPAPKRSSNGEGKEMWLWWFADHAVLILFVLISIIALSFTIESVSAVRDKLVPDMTVLRQRLGESYGHVVETISHGLNSLVEVLPKWGEDPANQAAQPPKATQPSP